uniref:G-protein coupled receptors family 3 profile domain-containing protein n=1 Tax=Xenopus tropicalis TaxID=8364 RepID=A0A1B8Y9M9_XENTR
MSGAEYQVPNYDCWEKAKLMGYVGDVPSSTKFSLAQLISMFRFPQASRSTIFFLYGALEKTIPNEEAEMDGIVQILKHFGWKWVGLIISNDDTGYRAREKISKGLSSVGGCLAFTAVLREIAHISYHHSEEILQQIRKTSAYVIVLYIGTRYASAFTSIFAISRIPTKFWITSSFFPKVTIFRHQKIKTTLNGSLSLLIQEGEIPGFEQFFYRFSPNKYNDDLTINTWAWLFGCSFPPHVYVRLQTGGTAKNCTGKETMSAADVSVYGDHNYRVTYRVYTAVYALARALHNLYSAQPLANHWGQLRTLKRKVKAWQLNKYIRNLTFTTSTGDTVAFNDKGDPSAFDIVKWFFLPDGRVKRQKVGQFNLLNKNEKQLYINGGADIWGPYSKQMPLSQCNEPCAPGYRKAKIEGKPSCCYGCVRCADGEMSNTTDSFYIYITFNSFCVFPLGNQKILPINMFISDAANCERCSEYQKSNTERTECLLKAINFLSYTDTMGASLTVIAFILFITASVVLGIFVKYWETPIVRANNQYLSCLLLISLMLCFLCTLLFIGRPTQICCLLRQVIFGVVFTISVSSVLAKTLTVIIAFNATKPGSKLKKYVGTQLAIVLVIICSLGSTVISAVWMASHPPFLEADTVSEMDTVILMCNEGSVFFFFCAIGYMGAPAVLSFIAAFLAKDFPDRFNEAKNITFSMLVFCSVWVAFVPAYLSNKGSRMVAVEIFAILSSSAGLLGCIFAPKCYIIFLQPELNTRTF